MAHPKPPGSFREYLNTYKEVWAVLQWINEEISDRESWKHIKRMFFFSLGVILMSSLAQAATGLIFSGLALRNGLWVIAGIGGSALCLDVQKRLDRRKAKAREWIMGIHLANMDRRVLELFFEKSPGQHMRENLLSVSTINNGRSNLYSIQSLVFFDAIPTISNLLVSIVLLLYLSRLSGGFMTLSVVGYLICSVYLNYHVIKECAPIDRDWRRLRRRQTDRMEKATRVIISSQEIRELSEMMETFNETMRRDRRFWLWFIDASKWRNYNNIFFYLTTLAYGSYLVWNGVWQIGLLYPLFSWSKSIIDNIWGLADIEQKVSWFIPSIRHMIKALSLPSDVPEAPDAVSISTSTPQRIVFDDVSYCYSKNEVTSFDPEEEDEDDGDKDEDEATHTLKHVSFAIEPGEKVALLGPSGAGKTTLMRLAMRFMDPLSGSITIGGTNLRKVRKASWMKSIGYIAQHPEVFDWTIKENLTYRLSEAERKRLSEAEIWDLMGRLQIDFGKRLDKGLETRVGKHGLKLSGGQAQRLMIGAAVIGNPWFVIIDEATSSLDSTTERKVQKGLEESLAGSTSALIVAHRLSTVRNLCTKFIVLRPAEDVKEGESQVEAVAGSFEELYELSSTFRSLADDQGIKVFHALPV